jgi:hypothetical protein
MVALVNLSNIVPSFSPIKAVWGVDYFEFKIFYLYCIFLLVLRDSDDILLSSSL